jgi:MarR family transcriptional regulator, lower aerobic nicotinate degradation pathway regulator
MAKAVHPQIRNAPATQGAHPTPRHPIALARRFYQIATAVAVEVHTREATSLRHLEFGVMVRIHDTPGLDQNSLAEWMALDRTTISGLVFRLDELGLIERAVNGADRRARVLRLTRAGKALHDRIRAKTEAAQQGILAVLAPAERRAFIDMLARVIEANQAYVGAGAGRRPPGRRKAERTQGGAL